MIDADSATDTRNVIDRYKGMPLSDIVADLDTNGSRLEIALDNVERDYNMGTIVRSANAFGVRHVHVVGRKQWNKRGAMMTDKYLHIHYYATTNEFIAAMRDKTLIAVDIITGAQPIEQVTMPDNTVLLFGAEGPGIRPELLVAAKAVAEISQQGSTRSLNVGVAAGIAMYEWTRRHQG